MPKRATQLALAAMGISLASFGLGGWCAGVLSDRKARADPCSVRLWSPHDGAFILKSQDPGDCLELSPQKLFSGMWADYAYTEHFVPDGARDTGISLALDGLARAQIYWLAKLRGPPRAFSGRGYHLVIKGRRGQRKSFPTDGGRDVIVVDEVLSATLLPAGHAILR